MTPSRSHSATSTVMATATQMPADNDDTWSVALGDVDGDGDLDIAIGNYGQQNQLYLNDGTGTFTDATATHMPVVSSLTSSVALGDVDGDGDLDMVLGNGHPSGFPVYLQQNHLYLNDGAGTFSDATATQMPWANSATRSVALGDVDGDGDLDLVFGNSGWWNRLCLNNGTGTFSDATATQMPVDNDDTWSVALGDVDGDGELDIAIGNNNFWSGGKTAST
mgnify:CR=1 FL=1